jgi:hypothetical protein
MSGTFLSKHIELLIENINCRFHPQPRSCSPDRSIRLAQICGLRTARSSRQKESCPKRNGQTKNVVGYREMFQERNRELLKEARGVDEWLPESGKWRAEETTVLYEKTMKWCAEIAAKSGSAKGAESRQKLWSEYKEFLAKNAIGVTVETAGAEDVLAFI